MTLRAARPSLLAGAHGRATDGVAGRPSTYNSKPRMPISAVAAIRNSHICHGIFSSTLAPIKRAGAGTLRRPRQIGRAHV